MFDSIYIGMSALNASAEALRSLSNNVSNSNTVGFKGSKLQFVDLFSQGSNQNGQASGSAYGSGVALPRSSVNYSAGDTVLTGNELDLKINGGSFFVLQDAQGQLFYTRDGQFSFNADNILVSRLDPGKRVLALDPAGGLRSVDISMALLKPGQATSKLSFQANSFLDTGSTSSTVIPPATVTVYDSAGGAHRLTLKFTKSANTPGSGGAFELEVKDGSTTVVGGLQVQFDAQGQALLPELQLQYAPPGSEPLQLTLALDQLRARSTGSNDPTSVFTVRAGDGFAPGELVAKAFDADGRVVLTYANRESAQPFQLALARFDHIAELHQVGGSLFQSSGLHDVSYGAAGESFGTLLLKSIEKSNVNLTQEFTDLILYQRSFQGASQVISSANEMLQKLYEMGRR
jgi:flagellar hook protein FlgE